LRTDIQHKLNRLKSWKSSEQRTESTSVSPQHLNRPHGQPQESNGVSPQHLNRQLTSTRTSHANKHKYNNTEGYSDVDDDIQGQDNDILYQNKEKSKVFRSMQDSDRSMRDPDSRSVHDHRTIIFDSAEEPDILVEPMDSHMANGDLHVGTESEGTSRDENKDTGNTVRDKEVKPKIKSHSAIHNEGEASGNIQVSSLHSVSSDISDAYVKGQWSPVDSEDEESERPVTHSEENRPKSASSSDRGKGIQQPSPYTPRMLRRGDHPSDDATSVASVISARLNADPNRLRPKSGSVRPKRNPTPGGGSVVGDLSTRILNANSISPTRNKNQPRIFAEGTRMATLGLDSDDNDSYFRAPRSRFDKGNDKPNSKRQPSAQ